MLEGSGYTVCSYSYEDTLLDAMSKRTSETSNSCTGRRLRKSPDLLVYDEKNIMLVEVKTRGNPRPYIRTDEINALKEFWNDSILIFVVPNDIVFYAKKTEELKASEPNCYVYLNMSEFQKLEDIFTRVNSEDIAHYREIMKKILQIFN